MATNSDYSGRFTVRGEAVVTFPRVLEELGYSRNRLRRMEADCSFTDDGLFEFRWERSPEHDRPVRVVSEAKYEQLKDRIRQTERGELTHKGKVYLSLERAIRELLPLVGCKRQSLAGSLKYSWRKCPCRHLGGGRLEAKLFKTRHTHAEWWFWDHHIHEIKRSLLKEARDRKKRKDFAAHLKQLRVRAGLSRESLAEEAGVAFRSVQKWEQGVSVPRPRPLASLAAVLGTPLEKLRQFAEDEHKRRGHCERLPQWDFEGVWKEGAHLRYNLKKAAKVSGISRGRLTAYTHKLPVVFSQAFHGNPSQEFPGRTCIPTEPRTVPGTQRFYEDTILDTDLEKLRAEIDRVLHRGSNLAKRLAGFRTSCQLCDEHGIHNVADRIKVRRLLLRLADEKKVCSHQIPRRGGGKRGWSMPILFDSEGVRQFLGGRGLLEVANETLAGPDKEQRPPSAPASPARQETPSLATGNGKPPVNGQEEFPGHQRKPYRGGPRLAEDAWEVRKFCYVEFIRKGLPRAVVFHRVKTRWPGAIHQEAHVRREAVRFAESWDPPLPLDRPRA